MVILVSACLLGIPTRYDGGHSCHAGVMSLSKKHVLIPVCPEQLGGLPTPRPPCELTGGCVVDQAGTDKTAAFVSGAEAAMRIYKLCGCEAVILKARSPSCGKGLIYDGSFSGKLTKGSGVFSDLLEKTGCTVYTEDELDTLLQTFVKGSSPG